MYNHLPATASVGDSAMARSVDVAIRLVMHQTNAGRAVH